MRKRVQASGRAERAVTTVVSWTWRRGWHRRGRWTSACIESVTFIIKKTINAHCYKLITSATIVWAEAQVTRLTMHAGLGT